MQFSSKDPEIMQVAESWPSAGIHLFDRNRLGPPAQPRRLLVVGTEGARHEVLKDYALQLSRRIDSEVVLLTLTDSGLSQHGPAGTGSDKAHFPSRAMGCISSATRVEGALIECRAEQGEMVSAVDELCREIKRIEFVLTDSDTIKEALSETAVIPVFRIVADATHLPGGIHMSSNPVTIRKRPVGKTVVFGILTAALYGAVFWKADSLMKFFARGGMYAALPIATAIIFSFAHGAFASNLWSLLGIQARSKAEVYKTVSSTAPSPKVKPKRPRVYAYVNPFHNIELRKK